MTAARKLHVMEELQHDPAFRAAWAEMSRTVQKLDLDTLNDPDEFLARVKYAMGRVVAVLDERPELAALIEAAEAETH